MGAILFKALDANLLLIVQLETKGALVAFDLFLFLHKMNAVTDRLGNIRIALSSQFLEKAVLAH